MDTKEQIIDQALRHFAEKGYDGTSLREISRDAGLNTALIHYHFGGKEVVYREVISRFLKRLNNQRFENLQAIPSHVRGKPRIKALIRGYISPHLQLCRDEKAQNYVRLLARFVMEKHSLTEHIYTELLKPIRNQYLVALRETAPYLSTETISRLFSFAIMLMITAPFDPIYRDMSGRDAWPQDPEELIDHICRVTVAGFTEMARETERDAGGAA